MDYSYNPNYRSLLCSLSERDQGGGLTFFAGYINIDATHAKVSDSAIKQALDKIVEEAFALTEGQIIDRSDDWFFVAFLQSSDAVQASLTIKSKLEAWAKSTGAEVKTKFGIHSVRAQEFGISEKASDACYSKDFDISHRLMDLCGGDDIFVSLPAFDRARSGLSSSTLKSFGRLIWADHGPYQFPGLDLDCGLGHIQPDHLALPSAPTASKLVRPNLPENDQTVWGWRPAPAVRLPRSRWVLEQKIRVGRFGEVWVVKDEGSSDKRMIECCFQKNVVEQIKEESEALLVVKRKITENRNVLRLLELALDKPPYYLMFEHFEGTDLPAWINAFGSAGSVPFSSRLELVAQIASGVQGVHDAKLLHKHITPEHILVCGTGQTLKDVQAKITDVCIGHIGMEPTVLPPANPSECETEDSFENAKPDEAGMYDAPEVIAGDSATVKSDVYSVGVILCQLVLGNLSEPCPTERANEIIGGLKREGLIPVCAENPTERVDRPGKIAQELRTMIKERESRVSGPGKVSKRKLIETIVSLILVGVSITVLGIFGPQFLRNIGKAEKPAQIELAEAEEEGYMSKRKLPVSRGGRSVQEDPNKPEPESPGAIALKYLVFPLCGAIIIGTFIQRFGSGIYLWYRRHTHSPSSPEE